jgi:predicted flap endonuclease-1-like 5' DNA nuclease
MALPAFLPFAMMGASALAQGIRGAVQGKKADRLYSDYQDAESKINPISPDLTAYKNRLDQQERAFRAGNDSASQFAKNSINAALAQTQNNLTRAGGGVNALLRSQSGANTGYAQVAAGASDRANQMLQLTGPLTQYMNNLQYQRMREKRNIAMDRWAQMKQASMDNLNSLFGIGAQMATMLPEVGVMGGAPKSITPQTANAMVSGIAQAMPKRQPMGMYYPAPQPPEMQPMPQPPALLGFGPNNTNYLPGWGPK